MSLGSIWGKSVDGVVHDCYVQHEHEQDAQYVDDFVPHDHPANGCDGGSVLGAPLLRLHGAHAACRCVGRSALHPAHRLLPCMWSTCVALDMHLPGVLILHVYRSLARMVGLSFLHFLVEPFFHALLIAAL